MNFKRVLVDDYPLLQKYFVDQANELSIYSLASLIAWRNCDHYQLHMQVEAERVWFMAHNSDGKSHLTLPVGSCPVSPETLRKVAEDVDISRIFFVPAVYIEFYKNVIGSLFTIEEQPDFEDYVYKTDDLAELAGRRFAKKRNLIAQFDKNYLETGRVNITSITANDIEECLAFLPEWIAERVNGHQPSEEVALLKCEYDAFKESLKHFFKLEWEGILIRIDGRVSAVSIGGRLTKNMGVLCFEKALALHKGLYQYLDRETVRHLFAGRYEYVNKESDMGSQGLKHAKLSYRPAKRSKSFILHLR